MFGENSRGLIWHLRIFIFRAHIIRFSWKLENEEQSRGENQKKSNFSDTQQVKTARCNPLFYWGQRQCWVYIGNLASDVGRNSRKSDPISRPKSPSVFVIILSS